MKNKNGEDADEEMNESREGSRAVRMDGWIWTTQGRMILADTKMTDAEVEAWVMEGAKNDLHMLDEPHQIRRFRR